MVATNSNAPAAEDVPLEGHQPDPSADVEFIPMQRSALDRTKAVKFTSDEMKRLTKLQEWLAVTINPETNEPFIPANTFAAMVVFALNWTFTQMMAVAKQMAERQEG